MRGDFRHARHTLAKYCRARGFSPRLDPLPFRASGEARHLAEQQLYVTAPAGLRSDTLVHGRRSPALRTPSKGQQNSSDRRVQVVAHQ